MNEENLNIAIAEAERFLRAARAVKWKRRRYDFDPGAFYLYVDTAKTAAARRASMDLTRALAQLRKPS